MVPPVKVRFRLTVRFPVVTPLLPVMVGAFTVTKLETPPPIVAVFSTFNTEPVNCRSAELDGSMVPATSIGTFPAEVKSMFDQPTRLLRSAELTV